MLAKRNCIDLFQSAYEQCGHHTPYILSLFVGSPLLCLRSDVVHCFALITSSVTLRPQTLPGPVDHAAHTNADPDRLCPVVWFILLQGMYIIYIYI